MPRSVALEPEAYPLAEAPEEIRLLDRAFHSSRNILMSMRGYADLIRRNEGRSERHAEWAGKIVGHLDRMNDMFARVESLSRAGDAPMESLPVAWVVRSAEDKARNRVPGRTDVALRTSVAAEAWMDGRPIELVEATAALIENALEASSKGGTVQLHFHQRAGGHWALEILDEGTGLPPRAESRVGEPFFSRKPGHLGLGVYLSRTILQRYGCDVHVENRPEGGTRALVTPRMESRGGIR